MTAYKLVRVGGEKAISGGATHNTIQESYERNRNHNVGPPFKFRSYDETGQSRKRGAGPAKCEPNMHYDGGKRRIRKGT